jgi:hypothetical protein
MNPKLFSAKMNTNVRSKKKIIVREICKYYYLGLHKRLNNSRHNVH